MTVTYRLRVKAWSNEYSYKKPLRYFAPIHAISLPPDLIQCRSQWCRQGFMFGVYEAAKVSKEYMHSLCIFSFQIQFSPYSWILQTTTCVLSGSSMWTVWLGWQGQAFHMMMKCWGLADRILLEFLPGIFWRHQPLFLTEDLTVWLSPIHLWH